MFVAYIVLLILPFIQYPTGFEQAHTMHPTLSSNLSSPRNGSSGKKKKKERKKRKEMAPQPPLNTQAMSSYALAPQQSSIQLLHTPTRDFYASKAESF